MSENDIKAKIESLRQNLSSFNLWSKKKRQTREALLNTLNRMEDEISKLRQDNERLKQRLEGSSETFQKFYVEFENRFRGSEETVKGKLAYYLDVIAAHSFDKETCKIIDLGSGRGEWLEMLRETGYKSAIGVDLNKSMIELCQSKSLEVYHGSAFEILEGSTEDNYHVITGFHMVEHLEFDDLLKLLSLIRSRLRQGGISILETPNPRNLIVGGSTFHFDPTHRRPLPIELLTFCCEFSGFEIINVHQRNAYPDLEKAAKFFPYGTDLLKNMLNCGLDYSVEIRKA